MSVSGTRNVAGVLTDSSAAPRHSSTLYLGIMLSPGAASHGGQEKAQVVFLMFGTSSIKEYFLDSKTPHFFLGYSEIPLWPAGDEEQLPMCFAETEASCCCPVKIMIHIKERF